MRLHVLSDLHTDVRKLAHPIEPVDADVVVVAGDVCEGLPEACSWLRSQFPTQRIVTVAGNHSFYHREIDAELAAGRNAAVAAGIDLLENSVVEIDGVRFVGATLWTDYCLYSSVMLPIAKMRARNGLNDHRTIYQSKQPYVRFTPDHAAARHRVSLQFIVATLSKPYRGPTVVVSHHSPSARSVPEHYRGDVLTAAYASDLDNVIGRWQPALWVHGHTHTSFDYQIIDTRVICNPHGYGGENRNGFQPGLVIKV